MGLQLGSSWLGHCLFPEHHLLQRTFTLAAQAGPERSALSAGAGGKGRQMLAERSCVLPLGLPEATRYGCRDVSLKVSALSEGGWDSGYHSAA